MKLRMRLFAPDDGAAAGQAGAQSGQAQAQGNQQQGQQNQAAAQQNSAGQNQAQAGLGHMVQSGEQQGAQNGQQQQVDPNAGKLILKERPAWLGDKFHDPKTGEVKIEELAKAEAAWRAQISRGDHKPPATPDGYKLDFANHADPDIKAAAAALFVPTEDGKPDPILSAVQTRAHKEGVSQAALSGIVETFLKEQAALLPPPFDEAAEMAKLGAHGPAMLKTLNEYAAQQVKTGRWDDSELGRFKNYLYDSGDAQFLYKFLFDTGQVPEIQIAQAQQAAAAPDNAALDAEQAQLDADFRAGKITDQQATDRMADINARRAKIMGAEPTRAWPPPR